MEEKPMRQYKKWKRTGILFLSAAMVAGNVPGLSEGGLLTAQAARAASPVTEYDVETLDKFRDNVLEYWEIPGLVEQYNTTFRNQLEQYYYNPGSSTGLTRQQLLDLADELRNEAKILEDSAEEDKSELTRRQYEDYRSNIRVLKARAKDLEDAAEGKSAAGSSAIRALRITRDKETKEARALLAFIANRRFQPVILQLFPAFQACQFHQHHNACHFAAKGFYQAYHRLRCSACGNKVIYNQNLLPRFDRVLVHFNRCRAIFQLIIHRNCLARQFSFFTN